MLSTLVRVLRNGASLRVRGCERARRARTNRHRRVALEPLEDRRLLSGLTIIVHGHEENVLGWVDRMADEVRARVPRVPTAPAEAQTAEYTLQMLGATPATVYGYDSFRGERGSTVDTAETVTGETVIKVDWSRQATVHQGNSWIGDWVTTFLLAPENQHLVSGPIHLIGFSRGAAVITDISRNLAERGIWVDQFTLLDPHPVDYDYFKIQDHSVRIHDNVRFADNYWHSYLGRSVPHAHNVAFPYYHFAGAHVYSHWDIPLWYIGTIDTEGSFSDGSHTVDSNTSWYDGSYGPRDQIGYHYSRIGGGDRAPLVDGLPHAGNRVHVPRAGSQWANLDAPLQYNGAGEARRGARLELGYRYQSVTDATLSFGYDADKNPANGLHEIDTLAKSATSTGAAFDPGIAASYQLDTSAVAPGTYYVYAKITSAAGHVRYAYTRDPVTVEPRPPEPLAGAPPYGAVGADTGEYMLGDVVATVVFFESDGSTDPSSQDWNPLLRDYLGNVVLDGEGRTTSTSGPNLIEETKQRIIDGLEWWEETLANFYEVNYSEDVEQVHSLNFIYDFQHAHNPVATGYEPIAGSSDEYSRWAYDFLAETAIPLSGDIHADIRAFNHSQRQKHAADWAFTILIANDYNDADHKFASGEFNGAFSFSGGRHVVSPATRPASSFAHETGHIFHALDETALTEESYREKRGYYNTRNLNSAYITSQGNEQKPSIMAGGSLLATAWEQHVSSESSLAMIGWQDTDGDGVFDVLDVPLTLTGTGLYDPHRRQYLFSGTSRVQTLVNQNSSGLQNDISINEVSRLVYSLDNGATWDVVRTYNSPEVEIDVELAVPTGSELLVRAESLDPMTGEIVAVSEAFRGSTRLPTTAPMPGIRGFVWHDRNGVARWNWGERGPGWTMRLVDDQGAFIETAQYLNAEDHDDHVLLNNVLSGVTVAAVGPDTENTNVAAVDADTGSADGRVFGWVPADRPEDWETTWSDNSRILRIDLDSPGTFLGIDATGPRDGAFGRLELYDTNGDMLGRVTTGPLRAGEVESLSLGVATPEISYALVRAAAGSTIMLDNLQVGPPASVSTDEFGSYAFPYLPPGTYHVLAVPAEVWEVADPATAVVEVTVREDGSMLWPEDADRPSDVGGIAAAGVSRWHNLAYPVDVNDDWRVSPLDALTVISDLNAHGSRLLTSANPPSAFTDVDGSGWVSPVDALLVISVLNKSAADAIDAKSQTVTVVGWSARALSSSGEEEPGEGEFDGGPARGFESVFDTLVSAGDADLVAEPVWGGWSATCGRERVGERAGAPADGDWRPDRWEHAPAFEDLLTLLATEAARRRDALPLTAPYSLATGPC